MPDLERIQNDFRFHPANNRTGPMHDQVRAACLDLAERLLGIIPEGRELSLAITNLEQVMFWANAGIVRETPYESRS